MFARAKARMEINCNRRSPSPTALASRARDVRAIVPPKRLCGRREGCLLVKVVAVVSFAIAVEIILSMCAIVGHLVSSAGFFLQAKTVFVLANMRNVSNKRVERPQSKHKHNTLYPALAEISLALAMCSGLLDDFFPPPQLLYYQPKFWVERASYTSRERLVHRGGSRIPANEQAGDSGDSAEPPPPNRGSVVSARKARPPPPASAEALDRHGGEEDRGRALTVRAVGVPDVDSRVTDAAETFANLQAEHMGVARARQDLCKSACCGTAASQHGLAECLRNLELRHETALKMELKGYNFSLVMKDGGVDMPTSVQEAARLVSELSTRARAFLGMSTRLDEMMAALLRTESTISKEVSDTNRDYADNVRAHDNMQRSLAELRRGRKDVARYKQEINSLLLQVAQIAGVMEQASED